MLIALLSESELGSYPLSLSHRKRVLAVLQEMLVLPNTPTALVALLVEKLVSLLKDDDRRIQVVSVWSGLARRRFWV